MLLFILVLCLAAVEAYPDCLPPGQLAKISRNCPFHAENPNYSCSDAMFVRTSGFGQHCRKHEDCYNSREPNEWCFMTNGFRWTEKGCFCDEKLGRCIIERKSPREKQWAYCYPSHMFRCDQPGTCSF